jgi:hypothetical protein
MINLKYSIGTIVEHTTFPATNLQGLQIIDMVIGHTHNDFYHIKRMTRVVSETLMNFSPWRVSIEEVYGTRYHNEIKKAIKYSRRHSDQGYVLISDPFGDNLDTRQ